ncbi:hypothetical protein CC2G_003677 [Coprinopsis cinerea AmutBmut pab1-1]|nr:hypothetical protein CC2G_003677 [Coprinopsis cinerea AmutBmut pab1-1]
MCIGSAYGSTAFTGREDGVLSLDSIAVLASNAYSGMCMLYNHSTGTIGCEKRLPSKLKTPSNQIESKEPSTYLTQTRDRLIHRGLCC